MPHRGRLFISHGCADQDELSVVDRVTSALKSAGFDVFEYRSNTLGNENWRFLVLTALLFSEFGLLLESDRSPTRRWVRYEESILRLDEGLCTLSIRACDDDPITVVNHISAFALNGAQSAVQCHHTGIGREKWSFSEIFEAAIEISHAKEHMSEEDLRVCIETILLERYVEKELHPPCQHS
jgi:hypothetical protein